MLTAQPLVEYSLESRRPGEGIGRYFGIEGCRSANGNDPNRPWRFGDANPLNTSEALAIRVDPAEVVEVAHERLAEWDLPVVERGHGPGDARTVPLVIAHRDLTDDVERNRDENCRQHQQEQLRAACRREARCRRLDGFAHR